MFFTSLQPIFGKVAQKSVSIKQLETIKVAKSAAKAKVKKPKLIGRISEVTIAALGLMMLAPIGAIACAAGLPSFVLGAGAIAGLFGTTVLIAEQKAIRS